MFTLHDIVPWGRSFDEYRRMFALSDADLRLRILGCADGPASFNAEANRRGYRVLSCDPLYRLDTEGIRSRIDATFPQMMEQTRRNRHEFVWDTIPSVQALVQLRLDAMLEFLGDFEQGKSQGRYVDAELPSLPYADASFDLALCSHFLFLYTDHLSQAFHDQSMREMCRVATEVRIFPLLSLDGQLSRYAAGITEGLRECGFHVSIEHVPYEFKRGANQMMRIRTGEG